MKAITFKDFDVAEQILKTTNPKQQKSLGRKVANFENTAWDQVKKEIVEDGNFCKFTACESEPGRLKQRLLDTGDRDLVEVGIKGPLLVQHII